MQSKIIIDEKEYDTKNLSEKSKATLDSLQFAIKKIHELSNMKILLLRARNSYIEELKKEVIANKSGFDFGAD